MKRKIFLGNIKYENPKIANNACYVEITYERKTENKWVFSASGEIWNKNRSDILCGGQCLDTLNDYFSDDETFKVIYRLWKLYHLNDMHAECEHQRALGWDKLASEKVTLYHWRMTSEAVNEQNKAKKAALSALTAGETFIPTTEQTFFAGLSYSLTTWTETPPEELAKYYEPKKSLYAGDSGHTEIRALGWLKESEHPDGLLSKACPVCGYKYGSSWVYFPIPAEDEKIIYKLLKTGAL